MPQPSPVRPHTMTAGGGVFPFRQISVLSFDRNGLQVLYSLGYLWAGLRKQCSLHTLASPTDKHYTVLQ